MNFKEIQELIKLINKMNLTEFKMKDGDFELAVRTEKYSKTKTTQVVSSPQQIMPIAAPVTQAPAAAPPSPPMETAPPPIKEASPKVVDAPTGESGNYLEVKSPIVGTFYRSQSPEKPAYAKVGDRIEVGQVVCIVEAMKLFNEIESEVAGKVVKVLLEDAQPVEYDQVLFLVDPS